MKASKGGAAKPLAVQKNWPSHLRPSAGRKGELISFEVDPNGE
jgi:hypothetical protein